MLIADDDRGGRHLPHMLDENFTSDEKKILQILHIKAAACLKQTFDFDADRKRLITSISFSANRQGKNYLGNSILQNLLAGIYSELKQVFM